MCTFALDMKTAKCWIEAMRLRTLPVSVAGVLTACAFAVAHRCFMWVPALLCLVFALLCQIASNFANEYYDWRAGRDRTGREGPRRGVTEGDISPWAMKAATFATLGAASAVGLSLVYWGGWWLIPIGALIGLGALAYSTGPFPLSTHCLGEATVLVFFGLAPVNLTYYVMAGSWSMPVFLASLAVGLMGANVLIVNNYSDMADDAAVGKHTLATALGGKAVLVLYAVNAIVASVLVYGSWAELGVYWEVVPSLYTVFAVEIAVQMRRLRGAALNPYLGRTSMLMFGLSLIFLVAWILN